MKTKILSVLALSAILFTACGNDETETPEINDGMVRFSSGVEASTELRVGGDNGDTWTPNDAIGVYMLENGTETIVGNARNIKYSTSSNTKEAFFNPAISANSIYFPMDATEKVDFITYYPYSESISGETFKVDVSNQSDQSAITLMTASANNNGAGFDKTYPSRIGLTFTHHLAKVVLSVSTGTGVENLNGLSVRVKGMNTKADFNIFNPALSNESDVADITIYDGFTQNPNRYEAILLPVAALTSAHVVEFILNGDIYEWTISDNTASITEFEAGKKYTFSVQLKKTQMVATGTITAWETVSGGWVEAK